MQRVQYAINISDIYQSANPSLSFCASATVSALLGDD